MLTEYQAAKALIEQEWESSISGRSQTVDQPDVVLQQSVSKDDLRTGPVARVVDGGGKSFEPRGFGWTHRRVEADVTVELRTATRRSGGGPEESGHVEMFGERSGLSKPDRYGGLSGEMKRILDEKRKGFAEFCYVLSSDIQNESSAEGTNYYRADVDITFVQTAEEIDPSV